MKGSIEVSRTDGVSDVEEEILRCFEKKHGAKINSCTFEYNSWAPQDFIFTPLQEGQNLDKVTSQDEIFKNIPYFLLKIREAFFIARDLPYGKYNAKENAIIPLPISDLQEHLSRRRHSQNLPNKWNDSEGWTLIPVTRTSRSMTQSGESDEDKYSYFLDNQVTCPAKVISYGTEKSPQSTGTSQVNVPCLTTGMTVCIAVALIGEKTEKAAEGTSKIRLFHVYPQNTITSIQEKIHKFRDAGLHVSAAMLGGKNSPSSKAMANNLRDLFQNETVDLKFDKACEFRNDDDKTLGCVLLPDGRGQFITSVMASDDKGKGHAEYTDTTYDMPSRLKASTSGLGKADIKSDQFLDVPKPTQQSSTTHDTEPSSHGNNSPTGSAAPPPIATDTTTLLQRREEGIREAGRMASMRNKASAAAKAIGYIFCCR